MTSGRRIACLLVPDLPVQAELRAHPELAGHPFVVAAGDDARAEVVALSDQAVRAGLRCGASVAQARAACAEVVVRVASPALEDTSRRSLLDTALSLTPRAELAERAAPPFHSEAAVFADASGMGALLTHRGDDADAERAFASTLRMLADAIGVRAVVGIASSRLVALALARRLLGRSARECTWRVLPRAREAAFLATLPLDLLGPDDALAQRLTRLGLRRVGDLLALPRASLGRRLGPSAVKLAARVRGQQPEAPIAAAPVQRIEEALDLDHALLQLEALLFALRAALSRLAERLALRALATRALDLELRLAGGARDVRRIGLATPGRDVRTWLRVVALELEHHPPAAPVEGLCVGARGEAGQCDQLDLFLPRGPSPDALGRTLAELEALCGREHVGAPCVADDPRPDAHTLVPFAPGAGTRTRAAQAARGGDTPATGPALRVLRPPSPAQVRVESGTPVHVRSAVTHGRIEQVSGPWRSTGRWWSHDERYALDHFDVQVSDGVVARLCFDWVADCWRVDALYD